MAAVATELSIEERLLAGHELPDVGRYDEMWEGVRVMAPIANIEHQTLQTQLVIVIGTSHAWSSPIKVFAGINVSDRDEGWTSNYRVPDVAVYRPDTSARNCGTHWVGGPDFAVEIISEADSARKKLSFYERNGVRELMLIDLSPWALELYCLEEGQLVLTGRSIVEQPSTLVSHLLPLSFRLAAGTSRPTIEVAHQDGEQHWTI